ncbi:hypothetical protein V3C99_014966 [Haemonchus contortus]
MLKRRASRTVTLVIYCPPCIIIHDHMDENIAENTVMVYANPYNFILCELKQCVQVRQQYLICRGGSLRHLFVSSPFFLQMLCKFTVYQNVLIRNLEQVIGNGMGKD